MIPLLFVEGFVLVRGGIAFVFILENIICHCHLLSLRPLAVLSLLAPVLSLVVLLGAWYYSFRLGSKICEAFMLCFIH